MFEEKEEKHESFGMLSFSRINASGGVALHGSDLEHSTVIAMRLNHGIKKRGLSHDWYHATESIAEVYMSQNQFSELITSMNMGDGVPVTLRYTERDGKLDEPDFTSVVDTHRNEFKEQTATVAKDAAELLETMKELLGGSGTVKKADRQAILGKAEKVMRELTANMPYMEKCFAKSMDNVVTDAKGTIEAFYQHRVVEAGLNALADDMASAPALKDES